MLKQQIHQKWEKQQASWKKWPILFITMSQVPQCYMVSAPKSQEYCLHTWELTKAEDFYLNIYMKLHKRKNNYFYWAFITYQAVC